MDWLIVGSVIAAIAGLAGFAIWRLCRVITRLSHGIIELALRRPLLLVERDKDGGIIGTDRLDPAPNEGSRRPRRPARAVALDPPAPGADEIAGLE